MMCFNMNQTDIISNFRGLFTEEMKLTYSEEEISKFNFAEPVYLTSDSIKKILEELNKDQKLFKNFVTSYASLSDRAKISTLAHFCSLNETIALKHITSEFPNYKTIKTSFYIGSTTKQFKALANVYTKKGIKLSSIKTYKPKELEKLISEGDILIANFEPQEKVYYTKKVDFYEDSSNLLSLSFNSSRTSQNGHLIQMTNSHQIGKSLLTTVDLNKLNTYYKQTYLAIYKNCLNYLIKCTEFSTSQENVNMKKLEEELSELPKKIEQNQNSIDEMSRLISDTGKQ